MAGVYSEVGHPLYRGCRPSTRSATNRGRHRLMSCRKIGIIASVIQNETRLTVLNTLLAAQLHAVGPLPVPHQPLMFDSIDFVLIKDLPLPPPFPGGPIEPARPENFAPVDPPEGISRETGLEGISVARSSTDTGLVVERGVGSFGLEIVGVVPPAAPPPQGPIHLHAGMQAPSKMVDVAPQYPSLARAAHVEGVVILE